MTPVKEKAPRANVGPATDNAKTTPTMAEGASAEWYPVDIDALSDAVVQDGAAFYVATDAMTFEEMLARKYPATETTFLPGVSIPLSTPPLPPLCDWRTREARIAVTCFDLEGRHQANELFRYLKRSGVGSVKATVA